MILVASDQSSEVVRPGEEPLHFSSSAVASQGTSVLGCASPVGVVGSNQFGPLPTQTFAQRMGVIGTVADRLMMARSGPEK